MLERPSVYFGYVDPETGEPSEPTAKQRIAHLSEAEEIFFGGAAGPGKSEWLIISAITDCLLNPGVDVPVFRRSYKDLHKSLILRFRDLVTEKIARYNAKHERADFRNGSRLWFCYCAHESDVYQYQSAQWFSLNIDESTHLTEFQVKYLRTRVRSTRRGYRRKFRYSSNPGNVGHGWHKRWFVKPTAELLGDRAMPAPGEIWQPLPPPNRPRLVMPTRQFIPARLQDNPYLLRANPDYIAQLYDLGGDKARQLAEGDWDANDSMIVGPDWFEWWTVQADDPQLLALGLKPGQVIPWHVVPKRDWRPPKGALVFGSVDYGYGAPWSFHLHAALPGGHTRTWFEYYKAGVRDEIQARMIRRALQDLDVHPEWIVMDPSMWNSRAEMGLAKSIAEVYQDELGIPCNVPLMPGAGGRAARVSRPQRWKAALSRAADGLPFHTFTTACPHAIRTVPEVPWDEADPEVEDDASENHAYEDIGRFFEARPVSPALLEADPLAQLDAISKAHQLARRQKQDGEKARVTAVGMGAM